MTPQELRASILQLAIQGKLVEQCPEEGTGEELFLQIQAEKQRLIKAGTIKKEKPLPEITEEEIPFDIPDTWKWIRLGSIEEINLGFTYRPEYTDDGVYFLSVKDISKGGIDFSNAKKVSVDTYNNASYGSKPRRGDILFGRVGTMGKPQIINTDVPFCIFVSLGYLRDHTDIMDKKYISYWMQSELFSTQVDKNVKGSAQKNLNTGWLKDFLVPLPPLAEQKRIVAKIEDLLPLIDRYEQAWSKLEDFNKRFSVDMQKSILQMAIQGKLVPQLLEEGTGEELFQQIQAEKQALIRAGTIKKEKPLPEITEDEIPFDIPESWKWVRVGDYVQKITDYVASGSFASLRENVKIYKEPNYAILVKTKDFQSNFTNDLTYTDKHGYEFLENSRLFGGELIMPNIGASIGKVFKVPYLDAKMTLAPNSVLIRFVSEEHLDWFSYYFASPIGFAQLKTISASTAQAKFSKTEFKGLLIPVPPLAEQKRIVAKLEEILPLCERLK